MAALTKTWTVPVASRQDPAVPITTSWGNDVWDNLQVLLEWLGADYIANAVQNHNHDGVNSAKVDVLEGLMPNGSFELLSNGLPQGYNITEYTGGTVAISSTAIHGGNSLAITSTVLANGGGFATQQEYKPITQGKRYGFEIYRWASVAGVSCEAQVIWYNSVKTQISASVVFTDTSTALAANKYSGVVTAPATAKYARVLCVGGKPGVGTAVGTVYFDGGRLIDELTNDIVDAAAIADNQVGGNHLVNAASGDYRLRSDFVGGVTSSTSYVKVGEIKTNRAGTFKVWMHLVAFGNGAYGRIYVNGVAVGTEQNTNSDVYFSENIAVAAGDLIQIYAKHATGGSATSTASINLHAATHVDLGELKTSYP